MKAHFAKINHESEFMQLMAAHNVKAMELIYDQYATVLYGVIRRIVCDDVKAEETLYKTFTYIWNHFDTYDASVHNLCFWMLGIARKLSIEALSAEDQYKVTEEWNIAADKLIREERNILCYAFFKGWNIEKIAERFAMAPFQVKSLLHQAVKHLKIELNEE